MKRRGVRVARSRRGGGKWALPVVSTSYMTLQPFDSAAHTNAESGIPGKKWEKRIPTKKREKSIQINNLKWHSKWHSASPFPATVSCSQTGLLYVSMSKLVPGETLRSRCLFFQHEEGKRGLRAQHSVTAGRGRGVVTGVCRLWPPTCNDHLMDVVRGQTCVREESGRCKVV